MFRVTDSRDMPVGVFDSLEEAQNIAPEVERWKDEASGLWTGWLPGSSKWDGPAFRILEVN